MKLDELRDRRRARRSRRLAAPSPWGTATLIVGAAAFVGICAAARSCADQTTPTASGEILVQVTASEIRVGRERVVELAGLTPRAVEERLASCFSTVPPGSRLVLHGNPGVTFDTLQTVHRAALRAGLEAPRLESVNGPRARPTAGDRPAE